MEEELLNLNHVSELIKQEPIEENEEEDTQVNYFRCTECSFSSKLFFVMSEHLYRHNSHAGRHNKTFNCWKRKLKLYNCLDCNFQTVFTVNFKEHVKLKHKNNGNITVKRTPNKFNPTDIWKCYKCGNCQFETHSILIFMKHCYDQCLKKKKKFRKWFECEQCPYQTEPCNIEKDLKLEPGNLWKCYQCTFSTIKRSFLRKHEINTHGVVIFKCEKCKYEITDKHRLEKHILISHTQKGKHKEKPKTLDETDKNNKIYNCHKCSYLTPNKKYLDNHIMVHHTDSSLIDWHKCRHCYYKSKLQCYLKSHMYKCHRKPDHIKWYDCDQCSYKTKWKVDLRWHTLVKHTPSERINWFECDQCSYKAVQKRFLNKHIKKLHMGKDENEWLKCDQCLYKAKRPATLAKHVDVFHLGITMP